MSKVRKDYFILDCILQTLGGISFEKIKLSNYIKHNLQYIGINIQKEKHPQNIEFPIMPFKITKGIPYVKEFELKMRLEKVEKILEKFIRSERDLVQDYNTFISAFHVIEKNCAL